MENSSVLDNQVKSLTEENRTLKEKLGTLKEKLGTLKLKKLSCKNTGFTLIGLTHFLAAVEKNPTLVEIHMENNKLDEKGCEVLNKFVKGKNKKFYLTKLDVVAEKFKDPYGKVENVIFV